MTDLTSVLSACAAAAAVLIGARWLRARAEGVPDTTDAASEDSDKLQLNLAKCINVDDFERLAKAGMPKMAYDYFESGAGDHSTLHRNRAFFGTLQFRPRVLVDIARCNIRTTVLGRDVGMPVGIAPSAWHKLAHADGELATARAAAAAETVMVASTLGTYSLEDLRAAGVARNPGAQHWFQLYVYRNRELTASLVKRAEAAGFSALAVTLDRPVLGRRETDMRNHFELPAPLTVPNLLTDAARAALAAGTAAAGDTAAAAAAGREAYRSGDFDAGLVWGDLAWLRSLSRLPIVLKGIMTAEDAAAAVAAGADAVWVSNHGGRQLESSPSTAEVLPEVVAAVRRAEEEAAAGGGVGGAAATAAARRRVEVYVDGGVRSGADAVKCLCLGADYVFVARPTLWGLAAGGQAGVEAVLALLAAGVTNTCQLLGAARVGELSPACLRAPGCDLALAEATRRRWPAPSAALN